MVEAERIYLDSSILLSLLLNQGQVQRDGSVEWVTSEITELECRRTLDRIRIQERLSDQVMSNKLEELDVLLRAIYRVRLTSLVLRRAKAAYPTVVRSLDAIHLATAELAKTMSFASLDKQQTIAARAMGFQVLQEI